MKKLSLFAASLVAIFFLTSATSPYFNIAKYLDLFVNVYKNINTFYVDDIDAEKIITVGIDAMLDELDPYTDFIPAEEVEQFNFQSSGEYGGIGSTIQKGKDYIKVISPYEGSPADKAGLRSGDKFIKIAGKSAKGFSTQEVVKLLKGTPGTQVTVTMEREGVQFDRTLTREIIKIHPVPYYTRLENNIAYIKLVGFTENAGEEVGNALIEMKKEGPVDGIILDLKGNGGGLLTEAIAVTNVFVPKGQEVVTIKTRGNKQNRTYKTLKKAVDVTTPLTVLIDGGSASASEIVSGTIQDLDRGVVIGRNSFGKGLVQSTRDLTYNSKLKLTTAKYLIPSGRSIQRLNYAKKDEDGKAEEVPDSLRTAYKTKSGRTVYDGSGIMPDIEVEAERFPDVAFSLFAKNLIYDYSLIYKKQHPTITNAKDFVLTDAEYEDFKQFANTKDYDYTTSSEKEFDEFKEALEKENLESKFSEELVELQAKIDQTKENDIDRYKKEIKFLLEREIAAKYYYTGGKIANSLDDDYEIAKAVEILENINKYQSILRP